MKTISVKNIALTLIRGYRLILSPWIGRQCRFTPSCSAYAIAAIERYGAWHGGWLAVRRIGRCQPFCSGGYDPVPDRDETSDRVGCVHPPRCPGD